MSITGQQSLTMKRGSCGQPCQIYSRVVGYFSPTSEWGLGKKEEFKDRKTFNVNQAQSMISRMTAQAQILRKKKLEHLSHAS